MRTKFESRLYLPSTFMTIDLSFRHVSAAKRADVGLDVMMTDFTVVGLRVNLAAAMRTDSHSQRTAAGGTEHSFRIIHGAARGTGNTLRLTLKLLIIKLFV